ncbi:hypothetical protein [Litorihabitans aurantiacus]|uniref:hypothetical protein n=1 Tax=Litorihabitans aurantiacus TaxID=1930061 RepID=UPI0024E07F79|nr:hypothetical protein [Litorihabitans aurantiacus]
MITGDLWLLSWDNLARGLGLVTAHFDEYTLVWPISLPSDPVAPPAIEIRQTPLGIPLYAWPSRETGISTALFDRPLGPLLNKSLVDATATAFDDGTPPPIPFTPEPTAEGRPAAKEYSRLLVDIWATLGDIQWPTFGTEARLNPDTLRAAGIKPSTLAHVLGMQTAAAVQAFRGESPVTSDQAESLAQVTGLDTRQLITTDSFEVSLRLLKPQYKNQLRQVSLQLRVDESRARDIVASEFELAARSNGTIDSRLNGVFARLIAGGTNHWLTTNHYSRPVPTKPSPDS